VALVLAIGVVITIATTAILPEHLTSDETTLLSTVIGALVGALATYLGVSKDSVRHDEDED
jgi:hypothetical protein